VNHAGKSKTSERAVFRAGFNTEQVHQMNQQDNEHERREYQDQPPGHTARAHIIPWQASSPIGKHTKAGGQYEPCKSDVEVQLSRSGQA